ncbi:cysteine--tRNA ligase [Candidatus Methylacidithermus pantelleriae]|uniref:Cysteine--tRNA ligase n=1 Tax=Candidatus Methylacidithermus pantelleriae TaxID=2744239 RepID=A0A8J2FVF7_9BACT|nr:cysteine--tRNA ligase [Candidatus Methylacidithermus pantelleriae]CAF0692966.1 Cysteine--tRNA ligase [Candidatus Methylacidithermus pantelleriae]
MELWLYNTRTRKKERFEPLEPGLVRMYSCGPTVYHYAHIGNFRAFLFSDLLRRTLRYFGFRVCHVMNFTDVDDKTIREARESGKNLRELTDFYIEAFRKDMALLRMETPEYQPRATDHIPEMIELIAKLLQKGHAYIGADGSVYFRIRSFPAYGQLARLDFSGLKPGARVAQDEYHKEGLGDFVLWKAWKPEDGDVYWESPWGKGRPGWHIECSAMSMKYLGPRLDIHCGGIDLIFPHHENEIAQSESATGVPFVRFWCHCAHVMVEGQKMSKSLGNLYTVHDVLARGYEGRHLRYALLATTHYRQTLQFSWEAMEAARSSMDRIDDWIRRWEALEPDHFLPENKDELGKGFLERFERALADDLNVPEAVGHLFDFIRVTNRIMDEKGLLPAIPAIWEKLDSVLGLGKPQEWIPPQVQAILEERAQARARKDWSTSDLLRNRLAEMGWVVRDTPKGQEVRRGKSGS